MLGTELILQLADGEDQIVATYRSEAKLDFAKNQFKLLGDEDLRIFDSVDWQCCDLLDIPRLEEILPGIHRIYHCAALVSFDAADDDMLIYNNVRATANLMNFARECGVEKVVHVSSVAAFGRNSRGTLIDENSEWSGKKGNSVYARSKYQAELEAWRAHEEGLPLVVVNPSIIIGAGDWWNGSSALIGKVARGFKFYSEGINAFVDVRDVAAITIKLMKSEIVGERYALMSENLSYKEVFYMIADELKVPPPSIKAKPWMGAIVWRIEKIRSWLTGKSPMLTPDTVHTSFQKNFYTHNKVNKRLGFEFRPVKETIEHFVEIYKKSEK